MRRDYSEPEFILVKLQMEKILSDDIRTSDPHIPDDDKDFGE